MDILFTASLTPRQAIHLRRIHAEASCVLKGVEEHTAGSGYRKAEYTIVLHGDSLSAELRTYSSREGPLLLDQTWQVTARRR